MKSFFKSVLMFGASFLMSTIAVGQENYGEDPQKCKEQLTIMVTYHKQKAYKDAAKSWRWCYLNCPQSSKNIYIVGEKIMDFYIDNTKDEALKATYVDTLMAIYDARAKYFPSKTPYDVYGKKGKAIAQYQSDEKYEEGYNLLNAILDNAPSELSIGEGYSYMFLSKKMLTNGKMDCLGMVDSYLKIAKYIELKGDAKGLDGLKAKAIDDAGNCLSCELLDSIYSAGFEKNALDTNWLEGGIELLSSKSCSNSEVLVKMMEKRFESSPSAKTANILGKYFFAKQDYNKAKDFFNQAISLEKEDSKKVDYLINKAKLQLNMKEYSGVKSTANEVIRLDANNAEAYILIGDAIAYGSGSCSDLTFGGKEVYWVAVDYYNIAASKGDDASLKSTAASKAAKFSAYFPTKSEVFLKSIAAGDTYTVGCWINAQTKVRVQ